MKLQKIRTPQQTCDGSELLNFGMLIIDSVSFNSQLPNKSWGRKTGNSIEWMEFDVPTPGKANN